VSESARRNATILHAQQPIFVGTKVPLTLPYPAVTVATAIDSRLWFSARGGGVYRLDTRSKLLPLDNVRPHRILTVVTSNSWGFHEQAVNVGGLSVVGPGERGRSSQFDGQSVGRTNDREHWSSGTAV